MLGSLTLQGHDDASAILGWIRERRVDGIIFARSLRRERPLVNATIEAHLPFVRVGPDEPIKGHVVRCDNFAAGGLVADHLANLGHTHIAVAAGPLESPPPRAPVNTLPAR